MASSVGVNPIRANYGPLRVTSVHMLGGSFDAVPRSAASTMTHAHTFDGRLGHTLIYSVPVGREISFVSIDVGTVSQTSHGARPTNDRPHAERLAFCIVLSPKESAGIGRVYW